MCAAAAAAAAAADVCCWCLLLRGSACVLYTNRELVGDPLLPPSVAVGAYANGFVTAASGAGEYRDLSPDEYYTDFVSSWVDIGTDVAADGGDDGAAAVPTGAGAGAAGPIVGGCCGIFPEHIARVRQGIDDDGRTAGTGDC
jgi:hypothetical protein